MFFFISNYFMRVFFFFFQAEDGIRDRDVTGVQTCALPILLGLLYVFPILAQAVGDRHWQRHLQQVGPMSAGLAVQATRDLHDLPIGPWQGLGVLAGWAVAALLAGGVLLSRRDA